MLVIASRRDTSAPASRDVKLRDCLSEIHAQLQLLGQNKSSTSITTFITPHHNPSCACWQYHQSLRVQVILTDFESGYPRWRASLAKMDSSAAPNKLKRVYQAIDELDPDEIDPRTIKRPRPSIPGPLHYNSMHMRQDRKSSVA